MGRLFSDERERELRLLAARLRRFAGTLEATADDPSGEMFPLALGWSASVYEEALSPALVARIRTTHEDLELEAPGAQQAARGLIREADAERRRWQRRAVCVLALLLAGRGCTARRCAFASPDFA